MNRLIKGARFNAVKVRRHLMEQDVDSARGLDLLFDNAGVCFRRADPSGINSYLLSKQVLEYPSRSYQ